MAAKKRKKAYKVGAARADWHRSDHPLAKLLLANPSVTQNDLAKAAGVQPSTICRVLNGELPNFSARASVKVNRGLKSLGFRPLPFESLLMPAEDR